MGLGILNQVSILFAKKKEEVISLFSRFQPIGQLEAAQRGFDRGARLQWGLRLRRVEPAQLHHRGDQGPDEELAKVNLHRDATDHSNLQCALCTL